MSVVFFFFEGEEGIRDSSVTGVQTCALPIYEHRTAWHGRARSGRLLMISSIAASPSMPGSSMFIVTRFGPKWGSAAIARSEERRVGKECRSRGSPYH